MTFRGSEIACFDYALYNKLLLGNSSIIILPKNPTQPTDVDVYQKFSSEFDIFYYTDKKELQKICEDQNVDMIYFIKYGTNDSLVLDKIPSIVHCVFVTNEPHGTIYAGVSDSVANTKFPTVNHMIHLPDIKSNYRKDLEIPDNAVVFGRHGGSDTFDIPFVKDTIKKILDVRDDVYFIFCVKPMMMDIKHDRIIYLESFVDSRIKRKFINTCDAMIHASSLGESFGLSVLEFSYCNKPVITWNGGKWHKQHLTNLGNKAVIYNTENELYDILNLYDKKNYIHKDWNVTELFSPKRIMDQFQKIFIDPICKS